MAHQALKRRIRRVRRRLVLIGSTAAVTWAVLAAVALLMVGAWFDLLWELPPRWRIAAWWLAGEAGIDQLEGTHAHVRATVV